jgi:hypothetical protein
VTIKIGYDKYDKEFWYETLQKVNNVKTETGYQDNIRMGLTEVRGRAADVVVKALRYKPAGSGFDSRWFHCNFSLK